jgi:hypothetical protein
MKFKYNHSLVEAVNDYAVGWNVVRSYLGHFEDDLPEMDRQMERLYRTYSSWLDNGGYNEEGNYFANFVEGALDLITEIDENDGILPAYKAV